MANENKKRYSVVAPHTYEHNDEERTEWTRVGRAFPSKDGSGGFTMKLRAMPAAVDGEFTLVIKEDKERDDGEE